jgi:hypothetical protein
VQLEAQQELPPEDLPLLESGRAARAEGRFHSLGEHAVDRKFAALLDEVSRRHGFRSYGRVLHDTIARQPKSKPKAKHRGWLVAALHWGRDNAAHLYRLREALEASQSNNSACMSEPDPSAGLSSATPLQDPSYD